jgi:hypothetical protein
MLTFYRFSQDFELIDMNLPVYMTNYVSGTASSVIFASFLVGIDKIGAD